MKRNLKYDSLYKQLLENDNTVYVPIDAHCASADLRVRVYLKKIKK